MEEPTKMGRRNGQLNTLDGEKSLMAFFRSYGLLTVAQRDKLTNGPYTIVGWRDGRYTHHLLYSNKAGQCWYLARPREWDAVTLCESDLSAWHPVLQSQLKPSLICTNRQPRMDQDPAVCSNHGEMSA